MKIHFIGIGGIGVSALAQYYLAKGHKVSGSDLVSSEITDFLIQKGIEIFIGNSKENIKQDFDLVIYSPAVKKDNPEFKKAKDLKIKLQSYPEALGQLTKEYYTIAISGSHGKSTTCAMLGILMQDAGLDPTVIVGTKVKEFGNTNFRLGKSKFLVIEACEYDSSFLHYFPQIIVITNIDKEHLDYFKTFANVKTAFKYFTKKLPKDGYLIENKNNKNFKIEKEEIKNILKIPGEHNVLNALQVLQVARILGVPDKISFKSLSKFSGTWRRFEIKQGKVKNKKITLISDYAHHPNEIFATLLAVSEKYKNKKIFCVFQPHQHQRTFYLFKDFVKVFKKVDIEKIIITDIYDVAGREDKEINFKISSEILVKKINKKNIIYCKTENLENYIKENASEIDVLIIMGAGDIYKLEESFL
jgi:UDP-N-acetylmuramate--alanine ligase